MLTGGMSAAAPASGGRSARFTTGIVALLALAIFINYVDRGNLATASPLVQRELKLSNTQVGLLVSAFFWIYAPGQLLAAWLVHRINAYRTLALGLALWSLATILSGFASGFAALFASRVLLGVGESAGFPASSKLLGQHLPPNRLGAANASISLGIMLGPAAGTFFGGLLIAHVGWRLLFILFGSLSLLWLVPWMLSTRALSLAARGPDVGGGPTFRQVASRRELWAAGVGHFASNYPFYLILSWLPLYMVRAHGYTLSQMAAFGGAVYVLSAAMSLAAGLLSDRWMAAGASANLVRKTMIGVASGVAIVCMLMCAFGDARLALAGLLLSSVTNGLGSFNMYAIGQMLAGPAASGKWIGLQNCVGNLSGIVAPILTGAIIDATGRFQLAFVAAAVVAAIGLAAWMLIPRIEPLDWTEGRPPTGKASIRR
jgi:MFS family permease